VPENQQPVEARRSGSPESVSITGHDAQRPQVAAKDA
jgi:hypothetical protein